MPDRKDFFVSYKHADRTWAEWITWQLEEAKFTVVIQAWDFRPGGNFVLDMQRAASECERTIAVLSPDYLQSAFTAPEWAAAFAQDPTGEKGLLLPVRVRECQPKGLLPQVVYVDLVGLSEDEARTRLLNGINRERAKPSQPPTFPGAPQPVHMITDKPNFPGALPAVWRVTREKNPHFVGRESLLADIRQTLLSGQAAALTALHGMGGVGKTQLAAEYAYAHAADYRAVWWLNAEDEATLANDLAALAQALALPEQDAREIPVIVAAVLRWLNDHADWLLIYDNANDAAGIRAYLPTAHRGHVIVTSRNPNWRGLALPLEIKTLDAEAGAQFLIERTGQSDATTARELSNELGGLPLALEQAGAYCETTGEALAAYLRLFHQRASELLRRNQPANYPATVATTWEISFEAAQRDNSAAIELLNLCAFLAPTEIPLNMLYASIAHLPQSLAKTIADTLSLVDAIASLRRYSLIQRMEDSLTSHILVQYLTRTRLSEEDRNQWVSTAIKVVNSAFPLEAFDVRNWQACLNLLPHVHAAIAFSEAAQVTLEDTCELLTRVATYLWGRAQYSEARNSLEHALRISESIHGLDHPATATHCRGLGNLLLELGDYVGARQCFERSLKIDESAFGPRHSNISINLNNLGIVLRTLGDLVGSQKCFERALDISENVLSSDHPQVAQDLGNLGSLLQDLGDLVGARQCFERALRIDEATFGPDHPNVAVRINNLGSLLQDLGDLVGARQCFERALRIDEAAFGPDHPNVAVRINNLGHLLQALGLLNEARLHFERALLIFETTMGIKHPNVSITINNLGRALLAAGSPSEALSCFQRALEMDHLIFGPDHTRVGRDLIYVSEALFKNGEKKEAQAFYEKALKIFKTALGQQHPQTQRLEKQMGELFDKEVEK